MLKGCFLDRFALGALLLEAPTWTSFRAATGPPMLLEPLEATMSIGGDGSILRRFSRGKVANRHRLRFFEHEESLRVPRNAEGFTRQSKFACCKLLASQCDVFFFLRFFCVCQYVL